MRRSFRLWLNACSLFLGLFLAAGAETMPVKDALRPPAQQGPQWLRNGVIYEIFPRDFSPAGNLNGVTARLEELNDLGVTILWLMPVHPIGDKFRKGAFGSPYSISDYYAINPDYGTVNDLKRLVAEAHKRDLKVIMDLVAGHTAWDSVLMAHPDFYKQDTKGRLLPPIPEWTDVAGLNYANPRLREYMIAMLKYWVQECDVDGFRCDVAYVMPTDFWVQARAALKQIKPDLMLLAEASKPELLAEAFDIDYSWPLLSALNKVLIHGAPASTLKASWEESRRQFPPGSLHMRVSDNHDEARAVARFGIRGALAASALMFSLDGVPLLYNGMEVGDATESGDPALFDKLTIFWHPKERPPMRSIYRDLIRLRRQNPAFRSDRVVWLRNSAENDLVTLLRPDDKDEFVVIINLSNRPVAGWVELKNSQEFKPVPISGMPEPPANGLPLFHLNGFEWRVYHHVLAVKGSNSSEQVTNSQKSQLP
jgi:cyclomaltodextrinase / maltogenic alpha-amylase / neopullulanase